MVSNLFNFSYAQSEESLESLSSIENIHETMEILLSLLDPTNVPLSTGKFYI